MHSQLPAPSKTTTGSVSLAWSRVAVFASAVDVSLDKWLGDTYRIGLTEYRALGFLSRSVDKELRVNDLAHQLGLNPSSTTRLVSRLEAKGLARRDVCADDGRGVYAVIEQKGEDLLREVRDPYETHLRDLLSNPTKHILHLDAGQFAEALVEVRELTAP